MPDFVIGPAGIADLDPWKPRAILWSEIQEVRHYMSRPSLLGAAKPLILEFASQRRSSRWLPPWLWSVLPGCLTERHPTLAGLGWDNGRRSLVAGQQVRGPDRNSGPTDL